MNVDVWVRRAALAAVPALALAVWLLRKPPPVPAVPAPPPPAASVPVAPLGDAPLANGEKVLAAPLSPPAAVDLPLAHAGPELPAARGSAPPRHPGHEARHAAGSMCGGLEVRLITASDDPEWSFASISPGDAAPARLRRIGDSVGNWRVTAIDWDRVWVQAGGTRCAVGMHVGARDAAAALRGKKDDLLAPADDAPLWSVPQDIASAIDKQSETELEISRAAVQRIYAIATDLMSGVQMKPVKRDETVVGIELSAVPVDSLLDRLGIERGDVVLALNDAPCTTLAGTLDALGKARDEDQLVARLERDGQAFDLSVRVR